MMIMKKIFKQCIILKILNNLKSIDNKTFFIHLKYCLDEIRRALAYNRKNKEFPKDTLISYCNFNEVKKTIKFPNFLLNKFYFDKIIEIIDFHLINEVYKESYNLDYDTFDVNKSISFFKHFQHKENEEYLNWIILNQFASDSIKTKK